MQVVEERLFHACSKSSENKKLWSCVERNDEGVERNDEGFARNDDRARASKGRVFDLNDDQAKSSTGEFLRKDDQARDLRLVCF